MSSIEQQLEPFNGRNNCYISMVKLPKVGINPQSIHKSTPLGIYTYKLDDINKKLLLQKRLPYASWEKYIAILEVSTRGQITSDDDCSEIIKKLDEIISNNKIKTDINQLQRLRFYDGLIKKTSFNEMFCKSAMVAYHKSKGDRKKYPIIWNSVLRSLGITSLRDNGTGTIFSSEPEQTIFLSTKPILDVTIIRNKLSDVYKNEISSISQFYKIISDPTIISDKKILSWLDMVICEGQVPAYYDITISNDPVTPKEYNAIAYDLRFSKKRIKDILVNRGLFDQVINANDISDGYYIKLWLMGIEKAFYEK